MDSPAVRALKERASAITAEIAHLRASIRALEEELLQVDRGLKAMTGPITPTGSDASRNAMAHYARKKNPFAASMTIKQLVMTALANEFAEGATVNELLDYFARQFGRVDITRTSLSPQLSRLKAERKVMRMGRVWALAFDLGLDELLSRQKSQQEHDEEEASNWDRVDHPDSNDDTGVSPSS